MENSIALGKYFTVASKVVYFYSFYLFCYWFLFSQGQQLVVLGANAKKKCLKQTECVEKLRIAHKYRQNDTCIFRAKKQLLEGRARDTLEQPYHIGSDHRKFAYLWKDMQKQRQLLVRKRRSVMSVRSQRTRMKERNKVVVIARGHTREAILIYKKPCVVLIIIYAYE